MTSEGEVHIFFIPFLLAGHMIPMLDFARIFASRSGVKVTVVTVPTHVHLVKPTLHVSPHPIQLLTVEFPSPDYEKLVTSSMGIDQLTDELFEAIDSLKEPFDRLVEEHKPDCIISGGHYPWTADMAIDRGIARLEFHGSCSIATVVMRAIYRDGCLFEGRGDHEVVVVPGMPHRIEITKAQTMQATDIPGDLLRRLLDARAKSYGIIRNSFYELEQDYVSDLNKTYFIGPAALCTATGESRTEVKAVRGGGGKNDFNEHLNWLDGNKPGSVLYVCFGSMGQFGQAQLKEIAAGLESSGRPFLWVVRNAGDTSEWLPEGFEERVGRRGVIVTGWAPQMLVLNHKAVGGFMTHCGWGSIMEGATSGLPLVTWPLSSDHFHHENMVVVVMRIGVRVGSKICSWREEERTVVSGEMVKEAVEELMGGGEEAEERRKRAREVAEMARKAVAEGGSSYNYVNKLIFELREIKRSKAKESLIL